MDRQTIEKAARGRASREKGKRGEREIAAILRDYGYDVRRGQQYCGIEGNADVVGLPGVHIEVKRVEQINLKSSMRQAERDRRRGELPVVMHRKNGEPWRVTMFGYDFDKILCEDIQPKEIKRRAGKVTLLLDDWICFYREWRAGKELGDER